MSKNMLLILAWAVSFLPVAVIGYLLAIHVHVLLIPVVAGIWFILMGKYVLPKIPK